MDKLKKLLGMNITSIAIPLIVMFLVLSITSKGFLSAYNIISVLQNVALYTVIGIAQMAALSLGQFNLAIGSMGCLSAIFMGIFMQALGWPVWISILLGLAIAILLGVIQGILIAKSGISPFIITLALLSIYAGIAAVITRGNSYNQLPVAIKSINRARLGPVPMVFVISMAVWVFAYIMFHYTDVGKRLTATGANPRAAKFSGINVDATIVLGHALSGLFAGVGAFIQICTFNSAQLAIGIDWMMTTFVVAVLGGTLLSGGKISTLGTLLGSFLIVFINNALGLWRVNTYMFQMIMGIVLLVAYEIDRLRIGFIRKQSILDADLNEKVKEEALG